MLIHREKKLNPANMQRVAGVGSERLNILHSTQCYTRLFHLHSSFPYTQATIAPPSSSSSSSSHVIDFCSSSIFPKAFDPHPSPSPSFSNKNASSTSHRMQPLTTTRFRSGLSSCRLRTKETMGTEMKPSIVKGKEIPQTIKSSSSSLTDRVFPQKSMEEKILNAETTRRPSRMVCFTPKLTSSPASLCKLLPTFKTPLNSTLSSCSSSSSFSCSSSSTSPYTGLTATSAVPASHLASPPSTRTAVVPSPYPAAAAPFSSKFQSCLNSSHVPKRPETFTQPFRHLPRRKKVNGLWTRSSLVLGSCNSGRFYPPRHCPHVRDYNDTYGTNKENLNNTDDGDDKKKSKYDKHNDLRKNNSHKEREKREFPNLHSPPYSSRISSSTHTPPSSIVGTSEGMEMPKKSGYAVRPPQVPKLDFTCLYRPKQRTSAKKTMKRNKRK